MRKQITRKNQRLTTINAAPTRHRNHSAATGLRQNKSIRHIGSIPPEPTSNSDCHRSRHPRIRASDRGHAYEPGAGRSGRRRGRRTRRACCLRAANPRRQARRRRRTRPADSRLRLRACRRCPGSARRTLTSHGGELLGGSGWGQIFFSKSS